MSKEAMKLALDDLISEYHMENSSFAKRVDEIFREALAEPPAQQEPVATLYGTLPVYDKPAQQDLPDLIAGALGVSRGTAYDMMREALAEQQEPVGEIVAEDMGRPFNAIRIGTHFYKEVPPVGTKFYITPQAQPAREWVGLTTDDVYKLHTKAIADNHRHLESRRGKQLGREDERIAFYARAIEAKLKEKNT